MDRERSVVTKSAPLVIPRVKLRSIMKETPEIKTRRLLLKAVRLKDAEDIFNYAKNPNVLRYTTGTTPRELSETEIFVSKQVKESSGSFIWAIRLKDHPKVIGEIEFDITDGTVDYALSEQYWNQGIMTEAARAVINWAFSNNPKLDRISSSAMTANPASIRVQQKCGMRILRNTKQSWDKFDEPVELAICVITRNEWELANQGIQ